MIRKNRKLREKTDKLRMVNQVFADLRRAKKSGAVFTTTTGSCYAPFHVVIDCKTNQVDVC